MILNRILTTEQIQFLEKEFSQFPVDREIDSDVFSEAVEEYYQLQGFDVNYNLTPNGQTVENIIDLLSEKGLW